jgi:IS605 OrfB family transposase
MTYKLNPTTPMTKVLREYCSASRYFYNKALGVSKKAKAEGKADYSVAYNWKYLKNEFIYKKQRKEWEKYIPSLIKQEAINDLKKSRDSALASLKRGSISSFNLRFKSKKDNTEYFRIRKSGIKAFNMDGKVAFRFFERKTNKLLQKLTGRSAKECKELSVLKTGVKWNDDDPLVITSDSTVCFNKRTQQFHLYTPITYRAPRQSKNQPIDIGVGEHKRQTVSIDPGVRSFVTTFDEHGDSIQVDPLETILLKKERIRKIQRHIDSLKDRYKTSKDPRLRFKILKLVRSKSFIEQKTKNRVKDMHYKVASFLCRSYKTILLPDFGTQKMVGNDSVLRKRTKDRMLTLSHYKFRQILALKAKEFGTILLSLGEEYTTKTCSLCGSINENVGSSKEYRCTSHCNYIADRDVNGARNIFIKGVVELQTPNRHARVA